MNHDSEGDPKVDQTIQWARESLQRRRSELLEKKKSLIATYKDDESCLSSNTPVDVHSMLERGRALLAEAEAHSEILGQYADSGNIGRIRIPSDDISDEPTITDQSQRIDSRSSISDPSKDDFMSRFLQDTNNVNHNHYGSNTVDSIANSRRITPNLPVEMPEWGNESRQNDRQSSQEQEFGGNVDLQVQLREGEARARLDELIATVRRQGDDMPSHADMGHTPTKTISSFDPSSMKAARRAAPKKIKLDEETAAAEEEARQLTSFKALPLPGGVEVKNDLFASTQSFQGKQIGSVEKLVRRDTKSDQRNDASSSVSGSLGAFDGISMVSSRTSHDNDNSFSFSGYENEADRERAKQLRAEKKTKKRQLLDAVNQIIMEDMQATSLAEEDANSVFSEGCDIVEDPSKLRQDIARLEAKLKQKKTQRLATLNDIVDIDLNALFDRLLSRETEDDVKYIIDRLKNQVCGNVNDFHIIPNVEESRLEMDEQHRRMSLYKRHEEWAQEREQRLFHARIQQEADAMDGITGRPELSTATRSWKKAKESHDETLKKFADEEQRKIQDKEAKEKATDEMKMKEMKELQNNANSKLKSMKSEVNKEEQMQRLEMLSRPRQTREVHFDIEHETDSSRSDKQLHLTPKSKIFLPAKSKRKKSSHHEKPVNNPNSIPVKKPDEFCGKPSFSEMSEKEFRKLVKRLGK